MSASDDDELVPVVAAPRPVDPHGDRVNPIEFVAAAVVAALVAGSIAFRVLVAVLW